MEKLGRAPTAAEKADIEKAASEQAAAYAKKTGKSVKGKGKGMSKGIAKGNPGLQSRARFISRATATSRSKSQNRRARRCSKNGNARTSRPLAPIRRTCFS
jgi:hypothetical protein